MQHHTPPLSGPAHPASTSEGYSCPSRGLPAFPADYGGERRPRLSDNTARRCSGRGGRHSGQCPGSAAPRGLRGPRFSREREAEGTAPPSGGRGGAGRNGPGQGQGPGQGPGRVGAERSGSGAMLAALAATWSLLAAAWSLLAAAFLAALLLLRRAPAPRPGRAGLVIAGLFQDLIRYGKTKRGCGQLPGWLQLLQVPKRWFTHFYVVSVLWNGFLLISLFRAEFLGESLPSWIQDMHHALGRDSQSKDTDSEHFSALLVLLLLWLHSCRRLAECLWTSVFSSGVIHIVQYCFGLGYYIAVGSTVLCQVPTNVRNGKKLSVQICWYHIIGVMVYIWASLHQHRCLAILANLRKSRSGKVVSLSHSVPFGDWFESISCPHYFAELLIYVSMAITLGMHNVTWWCVVMYVLFNQALAAILCHEFYQKNFSSYPKERKAFIPLVF
ncbi:LOW QUALITY PROTEIN: polyprenol reductase [Melospiza georgiana]|uniref:LOW QUALITY PROTEIN: polyprenol reductase n=1 Tax=Melospiza georgiana TaxID=44398 RepID=UPI0025AD8EA8|nr:LOW QUALITY PROTEIN: polyprenol reductase [Melospiza georgiana]